ncbi:hypothetical protein K2X33_08525 [bacterium]|nr:hypothetical protein [bacterium]
MAPKEYHFVTPMLLRLIFSVCTAMLIVIGFFYDSSKTPVSPLWLALLGVGLLYATVASWMEGHKKGVIRYKPSSKTGEGGRFFFLEIDGKNYSVNRKAWQELQPGQTVSLRYIVFHRTVISLRIEDSQ